jgi:hypothetical protein
VEKVVLLYRMSYNKVKKLRFHSLYLLCPPMCINSEHLSEKCIILCYSL